MILNDQEDEDEDEEEEKNELQQKKFLIYIVNKELEFDEESVTVTFFKDITFGILYE